jgi:3-oxoadipate enol-lactonase
MAFITSGGARIYWNESGSGDPLLLIMGLAYTSDMWHRTLPVLSPHYRTIFFDNRGVGKSDVPAGPYSIAQMADDAAAVLDAAGVKRAHILGASMGGMIAQEFTIRYPERVGALILGCTACGGTHSVSADPEVLQTLMARATMSAEQGVEAMVPFIYDPATPRARIDEDLAVRRLTYPTPAGYLAQVQAIFAWTSFGRLSQIHVPTLIVHGEHDRLVPPENARILAEHIAGSKLVMLKHASHLFMTDEPETSHAAVLDFLASVARPAASV